MNHSVDVKQLKAMKQTLTRFMMAYKFALNGYQSLHLIIEIPVFMSDRQENVFIELQIRSIAMDFWASLEHKIYYKYNKKVPKQLIDELKEAAVTAAELDRKMEKLHEEINYLKLVDDEQEEANEFEINHVKFPLPDELLKLVTNDKKKLGHK